MYVNSPGTENTSFTLTFLGKKVGRHHSVAPAGKRHAWETADPSACPEDGVLSSRASRAPLAAPPPPHHLPGCVPDATEDERRYQQPCLVHNTHLDADTDDTAEVVQHKAQWLKRWNAFRRWIGADRRKHPSQGMSESQLSNDSEGDQGVEADRSMDVRIYIPYESAELCITQVAEDMEVMKSRHLEMVQELEENFQLAARESQERTVQTIRSHYQNKLNSLRRILNFYQEKVETRNTRWEKRVMVLNAQNKQLLQEKEAERRRSKEEAQQWHREKSKMLKLFSTRLDILHNHQASTLQELQMARQEVGKIQGMLTTSPTPQVEEEVQEEEVTKEGETSGNKVPPTTAQQPEVCGELALPLEGAKARLAELKESLRQKEREIAELLEGGDRTRSPVISPVPLAPCSTLLPAVIRKAHTVFRAVSEARALLDHMTEENRSTLHDAREKLNHLHLTLEEHNQNNGQEWSGENESSLSALQRTVRGHELSHMALHCIRTGHAPTTNGT